MSQRRLMVVVGGAGVLFSLSDRAFQLEKSIEPRLAQVTGLFTTPSNRTPLLTKPPQNHTRLTE